MHHPWNLSSSYGNPSCNGGWPLSWLLILWVHVGPWPNIDSHYELQSFKHFDPSFWGNIHVSKTTCWQRFVCSTFKEQHVESFQIVFSTPRKFEMCIHLLREVFSNPRWATSNLQWCSLMSIAWPPQPQTHLEDMKNMWNPRLASYHILMSSDQNVA